MTGYRVTARRTGDWWALEVPDLPGVFSQSKRLEQADRAAREAISLMLDVEPDQVEVEVVPVLPARAASLLRQVEEAKAASERALRAESSAMQEAARELASELSQRDAGLLMGVSFQRVSQLLKEARAAEDQAQVEQPKKRRSRGGQAQNRGERTAA